MWTLRCLVDELVVAVMVDSLLSSGVSINVVPMDDLVVKLPLRNPFARRGPASMFS